MIWMKSICLGQVEHSHCVVKCHEGNEGRGNGRDNSSFILNSFSLYLSVSLLSIFKTQMAFSKHTCLCSLDESHLSCSEV